MSKGSQLDTQTKPMKGICRRCGKAYPPGPGGRVKHDAAEHPEVLQAQLVKANQARIAKAAQARANADRPEARRGGASSQTAETRSTDRRGVKFFSDVPKKFEVSSALLPVAKQVSMEVWGWPDYDIADGTFIDTFVYHTLKAAGIKIAKYEVETDEELAQEQVDKGRRDIADLKADLDRLAQSQAQLNSKFDTLLGVLNRAVRRDNDG